MVNDITRKRLYVKWKLLCRHRNVLKSMEKVKALSWLAVGNPHGCNVGIIKSRGTKLRLYLNENIIYLPR